MISKHTTRSRLFVPKRQSRSFRNVLAILISLALASSANAVTITLDGTSGSNVDNGAYSTVGGLNVSLGFFSEYLIVAGGGGGGGTYGGGGGAGGLRTNVGGTALQLTPLSYSVTVGGGGAADTSGGNSSFNSVTSTGGGRGGQHSAAGSGTGNGAIGGSGGGGGGNNTGVNFVGGNGTAGQGNSGGTGFGNNDGTLRASGGGGGAGQVGSNGTSANGGKGGDGLSNNITGTAVAYAGGGGGAARNGTPGLGGAGGGGMGGIGAPFTAGTNGTNGLGGGGGGYQAGGSGIVIVRYQGAAAGTGGTITAGTGTATGYTLHTFTTVGASTLNLTGLDLNARLGTTLTTGISGAGDFAYNGPGLLTLAADSSYVGTTTISAGRLQIGDGAAAGSLGTGNVTNNASLIFNRSDSLTVGNNMGGTGSVTHAGTGTTTFSGVNSYGGATNVTAGTLLVNGNNSGATGIVTVAAGATLGGTGTIGGNTVVHGTHSPGNSPGIQTFAGNLTYEADPNDPIVQWELIDNTVTNQPNPNALFDTIEVGGALDFADPTALELIFDAAGSLVDWTNSFWATSHLATNGWLLYDVDGATTNFGNLSIAPENWLDSNTLAFTTARPGSSFSLVQDGNDIYLNYNFVASAVPEPSTFALALLGLAWLSWVICRPTARAS